MNATSQTTEPNVAGVRIRPAITLGLYALLAGSAGVSLWARGLNALQIQRLAAGLFLAFAVGFTAYRWALVGARRYSAFKAFVQVLTAVLFFMLLISNPREQPGLAALKQPNAVRAHALLQLFRDEDEQVRHSVHHALVELNGGIDLGSPSDPQSLEKWQERFP